MSGNERNGWQLTVERRIAAKPERVWQVVTERRFVFSDAFKVGWIPQTPFMAGCFELAPDGAGTRLTAWSRHWDEAAMKNHAEMGFAEGWGVVTDQLAALCEG